MELTVKGTGNVRASNVGRLCGQEVSLVATVQDQDEDIVDRSVARESAVFHETVDVVGVGLHVVEDGFLFMYAVENMSFIRVLAIVTKMVKEIVLLEIV